MKIQIRKNCFETNSSSMHSLSLSDNNNRIDLPDLFHGKLIIGMFGETCFNWQVEDYNDVNSKLNYFMASYMRNYDHNDKLELLSEFLNIPQKNIIFDSERIYIDHNSSDLLTDELSGKDDILNFLFDPTSILHCDNDNH